MNGSEHAGHLAANLGDMIGSDEAAMTLRKATALPASQQVLDKEAHWEAAAQSLPAGPAQRLFQRFLAALNRKENPTAFAREFLDQDEAQALAMRVARAGERALEALRDGSLLIYRDLVEGEATVLGPLAALEALSGAFDELTTAQSSLEQASSRVSALEAEVQDKLEELELAAQGRDQHESDHRESLATLTAAKLEGEAEVDELTERVAELRRSVRRVIAAPAPLERAARIVRATCPESPGAPSLIVEGVRHGGGVRALQAVVLGAKVQALRAGRLHIADADVDASLLPALRHRLVLSLEGEARGWTPEEFVAAARGSIGAG